MPLNQSYYKIEHYCSAADFADLRRLNHHRNYMDLVSLIKADGGCSMIFWWFKLIDDTKKNYAKFPN